MLPDNVSDAQAILLSDVFPTGYFGAQLAEVKRGDTVAVFGCGPVGQFAIASARLQSSAPSSNFRCSIRIAPRVLSVIGVGGTSLSALSSAVVTTGTRVSDGRERSFVQRVAGVSGIRGFRRET